jgi:hypothetical protein
VCVWGGGGVGNIKTAYNNETTVIQSNRGKVSSRALGTLPKDGNVMPKHVGATIHN